MQIHFKQIDRVADCSTSGLTQRDLEIMSDENAPYHIAHTDGDYGDWFYTSSDDDDPQMRENLLGYGFSEAFADRILAARDAGIRYVRFDADGGVAEEQESCPRCSHRGLEPIGLRGESGFERMCPACGHCE